MSTDEAGRLADARNVELGQAGRALEPEIDCDHATKRRLDQSDIKFGEVVEAALCGLILVNQESKICFINPHALLLTGYSAEEVLGQPIHLLFPLEAHHSLNALISQGMAYSGPLILGNGKELLALRKDRQEFPVAVGTHHLTFDNQQFVLATLLDITELKLTQALHLARDEAARSILNAIQAHIALLDELGNIIIVNSSWKQFARANQFPSSMRSGVGINYLDVCRSAVQAGDESAVEVLDSLEAILNGSLQEFTIDYACHSPTEERWFQLNAAPLPSKLGGAVVVHTNITELKKAERDRKHLSQQLLTVLEMERKRLSRELHDHLGQHLVALSLGLKMIKAGFPNSSTIGMNLQKSLEQVSQINRDIRQVAKELRPPVLDDLGLDAALSNYIDSWTERSGIPIDYHCNGLEHRRLPMLIESALYRITQEGLTNVLKHAHAKRVSLILTCSSNHVQLVLEDDGRGINLIVESEPPLVQGGLGLLGMRERAELLDGTFTLESTPGKGTTLFVRIPLQDAQKESSPCPN